MEITIETVDAFTDRPFSGNPAAVCLLDTPRPDEWMQSVAAEINLSETAFLLPENDGFRLRWFTPLAEVELCGHATLASAHILFQKGLSGSNTSISFYTLSGKLIATLDRGNILMDFPSEPVSSVAAMPELAAALGVSPTFTGKNRMDYLVEVEHEEMVRKAQPDMTGLLNIPSRGFIVTSRTSDERYDFISRCFFPALGVNEDPVTGSAHCALAPYWSGKLGKNPLSAYQASRRGGELFMQVEEDRVLLGGKAVRVMTAVLHA